MVRRAGNQSPTGTRQLAYALPGQEQRASKGGRPTARGTGAEAEGGQEVGGPHMSDDVGEQRAPGPGRAKAARADTNLRRET